MLAPPAETMDFGRDIGVPVTQYLTAHGRIEGQVRHVSIDLE